MYSITTTVQVLRGARYDRSEGSGATGARCELLGAKCQVRVVSGARCQARDVSYYGRCTVRGAVLYHSVYLGR